MCKIRDTDFPWSYDVALDGARLTFARVSAEFNRGTFMVLVFNRLGSRHIADSPLCFGPGKAIVGCGDKPQAVND